ncbi:substrate-binding domain-containing protein [Arenibacter certesii]|uniref:ABC transporter substrate-binding protein n=1 Tax=Arenibacter certesii TaxID=228955 RepID=A0A918ILV0_9FLAO|nr:substrate-binding domain-containing protein [Arenibacter certesii]GGW21805.1 ABC transporter substrate-binding protein [Arenibacter certesii]
MKKVKIIGVPEHFNFPWQLAIEEGAFETRGIGLEWSDIPEGTGKMAQLLKVGEADLAIILTEGIVKSITEGNAVKIVQEFIASPLLWGIHVAHGSDFNSLEDLQGKTAAISRFGSGSHLMAYVNGQNNGWNTEELKFKVVDNIEGAVAALSEGSADYFMWERFMTKPLVDQKIFRRIADCPTPWPCFVVAATDKFIADHPGTLAHILDVINVYTEDFKNIPSIDKTISNTFGQQLEDIQHWISLTKWSQKNLDESTLRSVQNTLLELKLIDRAVAPIKILHTSK